MAMSMTRIDDDTSKRDWVVFLYKEDISHGLSRLARHIMQEYPKKYVSSSGEQCNRDVVLVGILTGAVYFTVDLSRLLGFDHSVSFVRSSSYHNNQTSSNVAEITGLSESELTNLCNKDVIVLDELYDSGRTLHEVISYLKVYNPASIKTGVMFRKRKEDVKFPPPDYCALDNLPDVWYVGYGLDDCGTKRELTALYAVPKATGVAKTPDDIILESDKHRIDAQDNVVIIS